MQNLIRLRVKITGIVQGVGMRPTIYRHAQTSKVTGYVNNNPQGVLIEAQGNNLQIESFINLLKNDPPPQAQIDNISTLALDILNKESDFKIILSKSSGEKNTDISPDMATCQDCINDIFDQNNRRYQYPFTNCTNCGPRFTIIKDRPYDRSLTSMSDFPMCKECQKEYDNPLDRRFHAQPNACPICGPALSLLDEESENPLLDITKHLQNNQIIAVKGLGGFNITCLPHGDALKTLRKIKKRPNKSFALMARNISIIEKYCHLSTCERNELLSSRAPIVLLRKKESSNNLDNTSPDNNYLGFMLPYTPVHHIIMKNFDVLVMTSANEKDEPIATTDNEIIKLLDKKIINHALTHNRDIIHRADDSIVQFINKKKQIIRRSRGIVPMPVEIKSTNKMVTSLSLGANMKNTFSFRKDNKVYLSQHIGELIDHRNYEYQQQEINNFQKLIEITPEHINGDAHPGYENFDSNNNSVYHHHAHFLSVIAEHNINPLTTLGIICDGTGFGTDETIWGFEFLQIDNESNCNRIAHLSTFNLPGGEMALREVDRIKLSLQYLAGITPTNMEETRIKNLNMLINNNLNSPMTSSLGRLFDGIASILRITNKSSYEAQAAILLQKEAEKINIPNNLSAYPVKINNGEIPTINYREMIKAITDDFIQNVPISECAYKFHQWIVDSILEIINIHKPQSVCLSGGCFQNKLLMELLTNKLTKTNMNYYTNELIPVNDAGISFGQAAK